MGKYNLGIASSALRNEVDKKNLYVNDAKAKNIEKDMEKQLDVIRTSLFNIHTLLNQAVNKKYVVGSRAQVFRGWAKKSKSQSLSAKRLMESLNDKYFDDVKNYPIKLLDDRIAELEKRIASMTNE